MSSIGRRRNSSGFGCSKPEANPCDSLPSHRTRKSASEKDILCSEQGPFRSRVASYHVIPCATCGRLAVDRGPEVETRRGMGGLWSLLSSSPPSK